MILYGQHWDALRTQIADWLTSRASLHYLKTGDTNRAHELIRKIDEPRQRAVCLVVGAQKLVKEKDPSRAAQWLQEAQAIIKRAEPDEALSRIAMGVVSAYAQFDNTIALEALDDAVKIINQSPVPAFGNDKAPQVKLFTGLDAGDFTHGTSGFGLTAATSAFAPVVFENVLETLGKISDAELRGIAIVNLCRKTLTVSKTTSD